MKKFLKSFVVVLLVFCVAFPLTACKKKISSTTTGVDKVKVVNGVSTNGGMTVIYDGYLYFINGVKDVDDESLKGNTRSAIVRVKYDETTGKTSGDREIVVDELVGFKYGTLNFFGDFMYYATPCADKNKNGEVLYNKVSFKRYDLVNEKSYTIFTTALNSSSETVDYAYYVDGENLNLVVYEKTNATITSLRVDKKVTENYVISDVTGCLLSENYGKPSSSAQVDASSFVFYTKSPEKGEALQTGSKVYKTLASSDTSLLISEGISVSIISTRAGKLIYSYNSSVYAQKITASADTLNPSNSNCISKEIFDAAIYLENYAIEGSEGDNPKLVSSDGSVVVLAFIEAGEDQGYFGIFEWEENDLTNNMNLVKAAWLDSAKDIEFMGLANLEEVTQEADEDNDIEEEKGTFLYAVYTNDDVIYKVKLAQINSDGSMNILTNGESVQLSKTKPADTTGKLVPEIIGNYLFVMSEDDDKNDYLIKVDLSVTKNNTDEAEKFQLFEEVEEDEEDDEEE